MTTRKKSIEEFVVVWFETSSEWMVVFPDGNVLSNKWGAIGYAVNAALEYIGRGEAEFEVIEDGDGAFMRYVKDDEFWQ